jgi:hypothetical protein
MVNVNVPLVARFAVELMTPVRPSPAATVAWMVRIEYQTRIDHGSLSEHV